MEIRIKVDPLLIALTLVSYGYKYITIKRLSIILGSSSKTAGRILAELERMGIAKRYSRRAYVIDHQALFKSLETLQEYNARAIQRGVSNRYI